MKPVRTVRALRLFAAAVLWPVAAWAASPAPVAPDGAPHVAHTPKAAGVPGVAAKSAALPATAAPERVATAPTNTAADPLEVLRQRLAERLSGGKAVAGAGTYDVRVTAKSAAPGGKSAKPASGPGATAHGRAAGRTDGHRGDAHWSYDGPAGPQTWGGLKAEFALCGKGERQSPIDIRGGLAVDLEPVNFQYQASRFGVVDNGHTVQANVVPGNAVEIGGRRFELQQLHFHRPSEERIDGRQFEMSVHLVHKDAQGKLAVVAILLDPGPAQPVVQTVWNNLPLERHQEAAARVPLDVGALLPADRRYYTYMGSLTTPPCTEGVQWVVMREPVTVSAEQIELFSRIYPMNARPLQQASGRRILQSN